MCPGMYELRLDWPRLSSLSDRVVVMRDPARLLREDKDGYAKLLTLEMGKLLSEAEVEPSAEIYATNAGALLGPEAVHVVAILD